MIWNRLIALMVIMLTLQIATTEKHDLGRSELVENGMKALSVWLIWKKTKTSDTEQKTMFMILWIVLTTIVGTTASIDKSDDTLSFKEQGAVLTPKNYVISGSNKIFASLFLKIKDPLTDNQEAKMLCVPTNCVISQQIYLEHLYSYKNSSCMFNGHNEQIQLIESSVNSYRTCLASCLTNPECQSVQWSRETFKCLTRRDSVDTTRLVTNPDKNLLDVDIDIKCLEKTISRAELCGQKDANLYTILKQARDRAVNQTWMENIKRFEDLKGAYEVQVQNGELTRNKRNPALLVLPVVGLLASFSFNLFNRHEIQRLQKHVNKLDHKFAEFTQQVHGEFIRQREFNKDVLWLLKDYQPNTERNINSLKCDVTTLATYATQEHLFEEYREKVAQLFHGVNTGVLTQPISPAVLSAEDLQYFVESNIIRYLITQSIPVTVSCCYGLQI